MLGSKARLIWMGSCRDSTLGAGSRLWLWELEHILARLCHTRESCVTLPPPAPSSRIMQEFVPVLPYIQAGAVWDQSLLFRLRGWSGGLHRPQTQLWASSDLASGWRGSATRLPGQRGARISSCSGTWTLSTATGSHLAQLQPKSRGEREEGRRRRAQSILSSCPPPQPSPSPSLLPWPRCRLGSGAGAGAAGRKCPSGSTV